MNIVCFDGRVVRQVPCLAIVMILELLAISHSSIYEVGSSVDNSAIKHPVLQIILCLKQMCLRPASSKYEAQRSRCKTSIFNIR
jgi:hypothetical protein